VPIGGLFNYLQIGRCNELEINWALKNFGGLADKSHFLFYLFNGRNEIRTISVSRKFRSK